MRRCSRSLTIVDFREHTQAPGVQPHVIHTDMASALEGTQAVSQTQEETQLLTTQGLTGTSGVTGSEARHKTTAAKEAVRSNKKIKISLGPPVDLGD